MEIKRSSYKGQLKLTGEKLIDQIISFPEHRMGYSLVDVTLKDVVTILQVPICNGNSVHFYDDMRKFLEADIASVAISKV